MYAKEIAYDRETRDFACYLDGELVGFARTYQDGETLLDTLVHELLTGGYGQVPAAEGAELALEERAQQADDVEALALVRSVPVLVAANELPHPQRVDAFLMGADAATPDLAYYLRRSTKAGSQRWDIHRAGTTETYVDSFRAGSLILAIEKANERLPILIAPGDKSAA